MPVAADLVEAVGTARPEAEDWPVVVLGAGPAGSLLARELARSGVRTLLADRARFPRAKVCGGCLNRAGLAALAAAGLGDLPARLGAVPLEALELWAGGVRARISTGGVAVSRRALDAALLAAAAEAGAVVLEGARGEVDPGEGGARVSLEAGGERREVRARVVVAACGLAGRFLRDESAAPLVADAGARVGGGASLPDGEAVEAGVVRMCWSEGGYVGQAQLEDGTLGVAAALDPSFVRARGGLGPAAAATVAASGARPTPGLAEAGWRGTPALTVRRQRVAIGPLVVVGDAAGYVEPFTGEGMAWALSSALALAPLVARAAASGTPSLAREWQAAYAALVGGRQRTCRAIARTLRRPALTRAVVAALALAPRLAAPLVRAINRPLAVAPPVG